MTATPPSWRGQDRLKRAWRGVIWASPGQIDAGLASLATFGAGVFAVGQLTAAQLGAYALLFSSFLVAMQISTELIFAPSQVLAVDHSTASRLGMLRYSLPKGTAIALLASLAVPLGVLPLATTLSSGELFSMALSASALTWTSPIQDHLRSMFHLASRSWSAAGMSGVHLAATIGALVALDGELAPWAPFGALAIGNLTSLGLASVLVRRIRPETCPRPSRREVLSVGRWLLVTGLGRSGAGYVKRVLINALLGTATLGFVEAARVVAQPINVLANGLMAQTGPRLTSASSQGNRSVAKVWRGRFLAMLFALAVPYIALVGYPWRVNPLSFLTPRAYELNGLTAAMLMAIMVSCLIRPFVAEMLGARLQRAVTQVTFISILIELGTVAVGSILGPLVVPLGTFMGFVTALYLVIRHSRRIYDQGPEAVAPSLSRT